MNFLKRLFRAKLDETRAEVEDWKDPDEKGKSMPCKEILIPGVDRPLHDRLMTMAVANGATFDGDKATLHNVVLNWQWDEPTANLHITPLAHPWFFSCDEIESKITQIIEDAKKERV